MAECDSNVTGMWNRTDRNSSLTNSTNATTDQPTSPYALIIEGVQLFLAAIIIFGNCVVVAAIARMRKNRLATHMWMANLAIADAAVGVTVALRFIVDVASLDSHWQCRAIIGFMTLSVVLSGSCLLAMSITCYLNVKQAISRASIATTSKRTTLLIIIAVWVLWLAVFGVGFSISGNQLVTGSTRVCHIANGIVSYTFLLVITFINALHILGIGFFQIKTYVVVKQHLKNMVSMGIIVKDTGVKSNDEKGPNALRTVSSVVERKLPLAMAERHQVSLGESAATEGSESAATESSCTTQSSTVSTGSEGGSKKKSTNAFEKPKSVNASMYEKRMAQIIRLAMLTSSVICLFVVCWLPYGVVLVLILYCEEIRCPGKGYAQTITGAILMLNSLMNVIVYTVKSPEFRSELKRMFCKRCDQK